MKRLLQLLFHGGVEGVARAKQHGVQMVVLLQVGLVEGQLAVGLRWFAEPLHGGQTLGPEIGGNAVDAPQAIGAGFGTQAHFSCGGQEVRLDIAGHETALFRFEVGLGEGVEVYMRPRQRNAGGLLVAFQGAGVDALNEVEMSVQPAWLVGHVAQHLRQVHLVEREHFADHVEHSVAQGAAHALQLVEEPFENAALNHRLAVLRLSGHEVESLHVAQLADAVNAPKPLFQPSGVPRQVVIDEQMAELQVDALTSRFGGDADLAACAELFLGLLALMGVHAAVDLASGISPPLQVLAEVVQRVAVLREHQQLAAAVPQLLEIGPRQTVAQGYQLGVATALADTGNPVSQVAKCGDLGSKLIQFDGSRGVVRKAIPCRLVQIVFILFGVR